MYGRAASSIFSIIHHSAFNAMRFDENPFTRQCEKENKKAEGFQISHFYWPFSSDIMPAKGLNNSYDWSPSDIARLYLSAIWDRSGREPPPPSPSPCSPQVQPQTVSQQRRVATLNRSQN